MSDDDTQDEAHKRRFARRSKAAAAGLHLPSEDELLLGMSYFDNTLHTDIREWTVRVLSAIARRKQDAFVPVRHALETLAIDQCPEHIEALIEGLHGASHERWKAREAHLWRCVIYLAAYGDEKAVAILTGRLASRALGQIRHAGKTRWAWEALAWATKIGEAEHETADGFDRIGTIDMKWLARYFRNALSVVETRKDAVKASSSDGGQTASPDGGQRNAEALCPDGHVVVIRSIGNETTSEGKKVAREFDGFVGRPIRLHGVADLTEVRTRLVGEFPHAAELIDVVINPIAGRSHVGWRPTVFVGEPGSGKTRLARRLAEELRLPFELISCGGMSDSAIGGTARRWQTGEAALPIVAIRRHDIANPLIILDEVEKVSSRRDNGAVHDVLVGLFEKETASSWHDPYLETACDVSQVCWLMTVNDIHHLPAVLRDRCRILRMPEPGPEHLSPLAGSLLEQHYRNAGLDPRWAVPLDGVELTALQDNWSGGSLRKLDRMIAAIVRTRTETASMQ